jgi:hypothetical protein
MFVVQHHVLEVTCEKMFVVQHHVLKVTCERLIPINCCQLLPTIKTDINFIPIIQSCKIAFDADDE